MLQDVEALARAPLPALFRPHDYASTNDAVEVSVLEGPSKMLTVQQVKEMTWQTHLKLWKVCPCICKGPKNLLMGWAKLPIKSKRDMAEGPHKKLAEWWADCN